MSRSVTPSLIRLTGIAILLALLLASLPTGGRAQGPAADNSENVAAPPLQEVNAPASEESSQEEPETLFKMVWASGATGIGFMLGLGLFSIFGAAVTFERALNLTRPRLIPADFLRDLKELVQKKESRPERFKEICQNSDAPISKILNAGLLRVGRPLPEVEKSMEDAASREMAGLRSSVRPLSIIGNVAPLLGLLGTVVGMIDAFRVASQAGLGKAELLAQGIYLALLTTAAGLIIAIPSVLIAAFFNNRIDKFMWETDTHLMETMPCFAQMEATPPLAATKS